MNNMNRICLTLLFGLLFVSLASAANETIIYVDGDASGKNDGSSWEHAFNFLQDALMHAKDAVKPIQIYVAEGFYTPDTNSDYPEGTGDRRASFKLINGVTLIGGFVGGGGPNSNSVVFNSYLTGDLADNDSYNPNTFELGSDTARSENSFHVLSAIDIDETAVMEGFIITGGNANGEDLDGSGGGIISLNASPNIGYCILTLNSAKDNGGALCNLYGDIVMRNSYIELNAADLGGGMVLFGESQPVLTKCTIRGNLATSGGGICTNADVRLIECVINQNHAEEVAGGIALFDTTFAELDRCVLYHNVAGTIGGALHCFDCFVGISGSIIRGNILYRRDASTGGGGIDLGPNAWATILNTCIVGNSADIGAGLMVTESQANLYNCTLHRNTADAFGGALCSLSGNVVLDSSILWVDTAPKGPEIAMMSLTEDPCDFPTISVLGCNIEGGKDTVYIEDGSLNWDSNNVDMQANLRFDGYSTRTSPFTEANLDIGADNFTDSDEDGLSDAWELNYFGNPYIAEANDDSDGDTLTNIEEYELYGSNPMARPFYVNRSFDANIPSDGSQERPFRTIQEGLNAAKDGGTVLVHEGLYAGYGNTNLDFGHKGIVLRSLSGSSETTIGASGSTDIVWGGALDVPKTFSGTNGTSSTITIQESGIIEDFSVRLQIRHSFVSALDIELISPGGISVKLFTKSYFGNIGYGFLGTRFDDEAGIAIAYGSNPFDGAYRPEENLSKFDRTNVHGTWTLQITQKPGYMIPGQKELVRWELLTIINPSRAIEPDSIVGAYPTLEGFTIFTGMAEAGGALATRLSSLTLRDCILTDNFALERAAGFHSKTSIWTIDDLSIFNNHTDGQPNEGLMEWSKVNLQGDLNLGTGRLDVHSSLFYGTGSIYLQDDTLLNVAKNAGLYVADDYWAAVIENPVITPTIIRTGVYGPGNIKIDPDQQLIVAGDAHIHLANPNDPNSNMGHITVEGSLVVRDYATIEKTGIDVKLFDINDPSLIQHNDITLREASTGFGGQFFVGGNAHIIGNTIVSEGDRYLDLAPDPSATASERPLIEDNIITVIIKEGIANSHGTLLELRAGDYDCHEQANPDCASGAYYVESGTTGFGNNHQENWILEKLILEPNTKLNLTNRQGFQFQDPLNPALKSPIETLYVKELVMGSNAVLNTALQTLYYKKLTLTDDDGNTINTNTLEATSPFINDARFEDVPLLGFSLGIIAMDDQTPSPHNEFDIRVQRRLMDPEDTQPPQPSEPLYLGYIKRVDDHPDIPPGQHGVMEMCTLVPDKLSATSVAAKGAFNRAGDEDITIEFQYMFRDDPYKEAELIVHLSKYPEVSKQLIEVARIKPPSQSRNRPGSVGSNQFALFTGVFPKGDLNFTRGTYIELELRGRGACCWIDNWDPKIKCSVICRDYNGDDAVDMTDYILVLAESGMKNPANDEKGCLDLMTDGVVDFSDAFVWEIYDRKKISIACPRAGNDDSQEQSGQLENMSEMTISRPLLNSRNTAISGSLLVLAKGGINTKGYVTNDSYIYENNIPQQLIDSRQYDGIGRLVRDHEHKAYCIDPNKGLVWLKNDSEQVIVTTKQDIGYGNRNITIGFFEPGDAIMNDAVFHPKDQNIVYIVPVRVTDNNVSYKAAAKLDLDTNKDGERGDFSVLRLYGDIPDEVSSVKANNSTYIVREPDYQHLREVELDADGNNLFVLSSCNTNKNNWILVYEAQSNDPLGQNEDPKAKSLSLNDPNTGVPDISISNSMLVSSVEDHIYMASSAREPIDTNDINIINDLEVNIYCYSFTKTERQTIDDLYYEKTIFIDFNVPEMDQSDPLYDLCTNRFMSFITSMTEDSNGNLYVTGYSMPKFKKDAVFPKTDELSWFRSGWFMTPVLATIPANDSNERYRAEDISTWDSKGLLSLPQSIVWIGKQTDSNSKQNFALNGKTNINIRSVHFLAEKCLNLSY